MLHRPVAPLRTGLATLLCVALVAVAAPHAVAQETAAADTSRWTPALSMQYRSITDTELSPSGSHVAYVVRTPVMDATTSEFRSHVWVASTDGSSDVQYTRGESSCSSPRFAPDGERLAFLSNRSGTTQVWVMRVRGGEAYQVTDASEGVSTFRWRPNGRQVIYTSVDPKSDAETQREDEKRDVHVVDEEFRYRHLYTSDVAAHDDATRSVQRLTGGDFHVNGFDVTPDGSTVVFAHQSDPRLNTGFLESDLSLVPADSGAVTPLVTRPGVDADPHVSPDGQTVAFTSHGGAPEPVGLRDVYRVPLDGGEPKPFPKTPDRYASLIGWAGDGSGVFVHEAYGTEVHVFRVAVDTAAARARMQVGAASPVDDDAASPSESPGAVASDSTTLDSLLVHRITRETGVVRNVSMDARASQMAFTFEDMDSPEEVYVSSVEDVTIHQVSSINVRVPRPPMGRTELVSWTGPGGREIEGLLTYPVGYASGQRVPLVLHVHGGPNGVFSQTFTGGASLYVTQAFAQRGYAVLRPNPRGSTGYGKSFRYAVVNDWGQGDYEDLMRGVDTVIDRGVADPDRLFLMGWSYGGYMTSFAVTRTDRFRAASMGAGLSNLVSMVTTTDVPDYLVAHMGGAEYWDDYERYERHSAVYRVDRVTTPTQVMHGAQDERVPTSQGEEFYRSLRRRDVPTQMVVYPRTPHGPVEPKLVMDVTTRVLDWFESHGASTTSNDAASTAR